MKDNSEKKDNQDEQEEADLQNIRATEESNCTSFFMSSSPCCNFLCYAVKAFFKCLGYEYDPHDVNYSPLPTTQTSDQPSSKDPSQTKTPEEDQEETGTTRIVLSRRTPPPRRQGPTRGRGGQNN
ncbi:uncharacterized protein LOC115712342 [Cannabis sativa]|uniref:uncharacterized protein LOC115712342 n=1 Tax=Cannabis sativa TaxID=3483 RepID=UPI0029CA5978|nr:uncharacterized protein LOC115712342 [Cannabis sativa]